MENKYWNEHLQHWQTFLSERYEQVEDRGEKIKIDRQRKALADVKYAAVSNPQLMLEFICPTEEQREARPLDFFLPLDDSQKKAVSLALGENVLSLVQGPPGTGKTQVITEICLQLYRNNPNIRILVCSETHIAVNNLVSRISQYNDNIRIVRIRNKEIDAVADEFAPSVIVDAYTTWLHNNLENSELAEIITDCLSDYEDRSLEKALALSANVTGMTCNRVGAYRFNATTEMYDVVIIDEVCKATLPEILMPLSVARKAILVGDPNQLPPVFCSEEIEVIRSIENCSLQKYMYIDQLFSTSKCTILLDTQYRMSSRIGNIIGTLFYEGQLKNGRVSAFDGEVVWFDYAPSQDWPPIEEVSSQAVYNLDECHHIANLLHLMDSAVTTEETIAVIAPYRNQVMRLRTIVSQLALQHLHAYVDTVDGFQGKECDTVVFSFTRTYGSYRFLADRRRLNVALSRAKNRVYMVGSLEYAKQNVLLKQIHEFCDIKYLRK